MTAFEKHIQSNFKSIFNGKLYFFLRRSVWKYLIASLLIAIATPGYLGGFTIRTILIWTLLLTLALVVMYLDAKAKAKNLVFDADVEFDQESIKIKHRNENNPVEIKDWSWIKKISMSKTAVLLELNTKHRMLLTLEKSKLKAPELAFLKNKMKN